MTNLVFFINTVGYNCTRLTYSNFPNYEMNEGIINQEFPWNVNVFYDLIVFAVYPRNYKNEAIIFIIRVPRLKQRSWHLRPVIDMFV